MTELKGKFGRVTGAVRVGVTGEVMIDGQHYLAKPFDTTESFSVGEQVVVVEYSPPRTIYVTKY